MTKVVLANLQAIVRDGTKMLLEQETGSRVVADVSDGMDALDAVER